MAKRVTNFDFRSAGRIRSSHYPWGTWDDGSTWRAREGEDFHVAPTHFAQAVYRYARKNGLKANVNIDDSTVTFRLVKS